MSTDQFIRKNGTTIEVIIKVDKISVVKFPKFCFPWKFPERLQISNYA